MCSGIATASPSETLWIEIASVMNTANAGIVTPTKAPLVYLEVGERHVSAPSLREAVDSEYVHDHHQFRTPASEILRGPNSSLAMT